MARESVASEIPAGETSTSVAAEGGTASEETPKSAVATESPQPAEAS